MPGSKQASKQAQYLRTEPTHLGPLLTADPVTDPGSLDARSPAPRAPPPACPRFFPAESAPHATRDKFSVWGGVFKSFAGDGAPAPRALQGPDPIRTVQESTQQGARRARGLSPVLWPRLRR